MDGAGFVREGKQRFHLFSFWDALPDQVTLVLDVHNYEKAAFRHIIPAEVGAEIKQDGLWLEIVHLAEGHHDGWSSVNGFNGEAKDAGSTSEVLFEMTGNRRSRRRKQIDGDLDRWLIVSVRPRVCIF